MVGNKTVTLPIDVLNDWYNERMSEMFSVVLDGAIEGRCQDALNKFKDGLLILKSTKMKLELLL